MRKILTVLALAIALCVTACKKAPKADPAAALVGEWELTQIEVKSVEYAGKTVEVYLVFTADNTFEIYQMIGQGRFRKFSGTWTLTDGILSGKYASKKAWGSEYEATVKGETLTLVSTVSGETDTYQKAAVPDSVKTEAYEE